MPAWLYYCSCQYRASSSHYKDNRPILRTNQIILRIRTSHRQPVPASVRSVSQDLDDTTINHSTKASATTRVLITLTPTNPLYTPPVTQSPILRTTSATHGNPFTQLYTEHHLYCPHHWPLESASHYSVSPVHCLLHRDLSAHIRVIPWHTTSHSHDMHTEIS